MRAALLLAVLAALPLACWSRDNPADPGRCTPRCVAPQICWQGACVLPAADLGGPDHPPTDSAPSSSEGAARDRAVDRSSDGPVVVPCETGWKTLPSGTNETLEAVWGASADEVFAVGTKGTILRYSKAAGFQPMASNTGQNLHGVWGTSAKDVWAVGAAGTVLHWDGQDWKSQSPCSSCDYYAVWTNGTVYVVGQGGGGGVLQTWDGKQWSYNIYGIEGFTAVFGTSTDVFLGGDGVVYQGSGTSFMKMSNVPMADSFRSLWGNTQSMWGVGIKPGLPPSGFALRLPASDVKSFSDRLNGVTGGLDPGSGQEPSDLFAVGDKGSVQYFAAGAWFLQPQTTTKNLLAAWRSADNQLFVVGEAGTILHHQGPWWPQQKLTTDALGKAWGNTKEAMVAAGAGGILRWDGTAWKTESTGSSAVSALWSDGKGTRYALVASGASASTLYKSTALNSWSSIYLTDSSSTALWGTSTGELFIGGYKKIYQNLTGTWATVTVPPPIVGFWGDNVQDLTAVGMGTSIYHFDGSSWTKDTSVPTSVSADFTAVWGADAKNLFVVGTGGTILRGSAGSWTAMSSGVTTRLSAVWGVSATEVYAAGDRGVILRYDGKTWQPTVSGTPLAVSSLWGTGSKDLWALGANGQMLHWCGP